MSSDSDRQQKIISEQAADLAAKEDYKSGKSFDKGKSTFTSEESGVNEHAVSGFEGASVSTGRTGQTGGGNNPQLIPPEEGGEGRAGTSSAIYEDPRGGKADIQADIARNAPSQNRSRNDNVRQETGIAGERPPQELERDQEAAARGAL